MYNGFPQTDVTDGGANELAVTVYKNGIFTRGVLFDIPRLKGKQWLEPGEAIYPEDLDAWLEKTGVNLEPGDVVFIRTGRWARRSAKGAWNTSSVADFTRLAPRGSRNTMWRWWAAIPIRTLCRAASKA